MSTFLRTVSRAIARPSARAFSSTPSNSLARLTVIGNLGATPELKPTSTGREMIKYTVAARGRQGPDGPQTSWFNIVSFSEEGRFRDYMLSLPKGTLVCVEGDVATGSYTTEDGSKKSFLNVVQRNLEVLRRPQEEGQNHESQE
ncbi:hypothetical protein V8F20_008729 [Naviculisporaceae sp. PSN 640]